MSYFRLITYVLCLNKVITKNIELAEVEESKYLKGIRFDTNLVEDRHISTFLENYVALRLNKHNEEPAEISFCFRWQFYSMVGQCFFQETSIGMFFKKPDVHRVGYVLFYGAYVMFSVPKGIKFVPMVWHHICVSYKDYHVAIVMDGIILLNKTVQHFKSLNKTHIILKDKLHLGKNLIITSKII